MANWRNDLSCPLVPSRAVPLLGGGNATLAIEGFFKTANTVLAYTDLVRVPC
jgi:hypothetical protein